MNDKDFDQYIKDKLLPKQYDVSEMAWSKVLSELKNLNKKILITKTLRYVAVFILIFTTSTFFVITQDNLFIKKRPKQTLIKCQSMSIQQPELELKQLNARITNQTILIKAEHHNFSKKKSKIILENNDDIKQSLSVKNNQTALKQSSEKLNHTIDAQITTGITLNVNIPNRVHEIKINQYDLLNLVENENKKRKQKKFTNLVYKRFKYSFKERYAVSSK